MTYLVVRTILVFVRFNLFDLSKSMKIEHLVTISGAVLTVYYVGDLFYQYEILFWDGSIHQPQEMYETVDEALNVGLKNIKTVIGY